MADGKITEDGYEIIEPMNQPETKGVQCGKCGMRFDHGKSYGYYCPENQCPIFAKVT